MYFHHIFTLTFSFPGNKAEFRSPSHSGSISVPEVHVSAAGSQKSSFSHKESGRYCSFGGNSSVKPQNLEQCLTPLQQKDFLIEHLKRKLKESESKLKEREAQTEGLKAQLGRTKDEWLEEECIHMETELAFWEARKEVKQLQRMNESLENRLAERDKKIQEYGMVIRSVNKRLKRLLAQNVCWLPSVREEQGPEYAWEWEGEESLTTTTSELSDPAPSCSAVKPEVLENVPDRKLIPSQEKEKIGTVMLKQASQTIQ